MSKAPGRGQEGGRRITNYRPSPAMAVAITALVFSMTGMAAAQVLPNPLPLQNEAAAPPPPTRVVRVGEPSGATASVARCRTGEAAFEGLRWSLPARDGIPAQEGETPNGWTAGTPTGAPGTRAYVVCESP